MKTKFKLKLSNKEIFIPKYKKEKIYFPLFKNKNLRNNQNYVLWKRILKKINFYWNNTFVWWSMIRIITKKWLNSYLNDHLKKFLIIRDKNKYIIFKNEK